MCVCVCVCVCVCACVCVCVCVCVFVCVCVIGSCEATLALNFAPEVLRGDACAWRASSWPEADIFHAGWPCQPFSCAGRNRGLADERSGVLHALLQLVERRRFKMVLLENVKGLLQRRRPVLLMIVRALRAMGYRVAYKLMNARFCGLPQNRERVFILAWRLGGPEPSFPWPDDLPEVSVRTILEPRDISRKAVQRARPKQKLGRRHVRKCYQKIKKAGLNPAKIPMIMDIFSSKPCMMYNISPCLTRSRAMQGGHWVSCRGRQFTELEMRRLMGLSQELCRPEAISDRQWNGLLGNSIPVDMLVLVLRAALPFCGFSLT